MPGDNVRLAVYARLSDGLVLASHKGRATDAAKDTAKKVLESGNLKPNAQLTVTVTPEIGTLHLAAGDVDVVAVITATEYPRRAAFKLLEGFCPLRLTFISVHCHRGQTITCQCLCQLVGTVFCFGKHKHLMHIIEAYQLCQQLSFPMLIHVDKGLID